MHDVGFTPVRGGRPLAEMRKITSASIEYGWRVPAVKWLMVEALFTGGVGIYAFYALQPYLLELYGDPDAYQIAGLVAAIVAGAQILGGLVAPWIRHRFRRRTSALMTTASLSALTLAATGLVESFAAVLGLIVVWGLLFAATRPIRQAYLNGLIPSRQRATILSFDSLATSSGGVWTQPLLGRAADALGLRTVLPDLRRDLGARPAVPLPVAPAGCARRHARPRRGAEEAERSRPRRGERAERARPLRSSLPGTRRQPGRDAVGRDPVQVRRGGERRRQRLGVDDGQRAGGAGERGVEAAGAAVGALGEDRRGLDDDDRVELEALDRRAG